MNIEEYELQFDRILSGEMNAAPYDKEAYVHYVKMNQRRKDRWYKTATLIPELKDAIAQIDTPQYWLLITEPWCGDAANTHAFIKLAVEANPNIQLSVQNRDAEGSEIEPYLTNGGKSIPKLIARNAQGDDLWVWGPRPKEAQALVMRQKAEDKLTIDERMIEIQKWYNQDKGESVQRELAELVNGAMGQ